MEMQVKVLRKKQEAQDIASFELVKPDGSALPGFSAGSHIDVQVPNGRRASIRCATTRPNSIAIASPCCATPLRAAAPPACTTR